MRRTLLVELRRETITLTCHTCALGTHEYLVKTRTRCTRQRSSRAIPKTIANQESLSTTPLTNLHDETHLPPSRSKAATTLNRNSSASESSTATGTRVANANPASLDTYPAVYIALAATYVERLLVKGDVVMPLNVSQPAPIPKGPEGRENYDPVPALSLRPPNEIRRCKFELYGPRHRRSVTVTWNTVSSSATTENGIGNDRIDGDGLII